MTSPTLRCVSPYSAVPSVVPPPEWADPRRLNTGAWAITGDCGCFVRGGDAAGLAGYPCERHTFAALDSGLALLRGALAQQEKE